MICYLFCSSWKYVSQTEQRRDWKQCQRPNSDGTVRSAATGSEHARAEIGWHYPPGLPRPSRVPWKHPMQAQNRCDWQRLQRPWGACSLSSAAIDIWAGARPENSFAVRSW